jgi:tetratricopeptide (TPR) repeat protein
MNKIILFSYLCFTPTLMLAQANIDSLYQVWLNLGLADTTRLSAMHNLGVAYLRVNPDSARIFAQEALQFAQKIHHRRWEGRARRSIGMTWRLQSDFDKAQENYEQSIRLLEASGDIRSLAEVYIDLSDIYRLQSNFPKAIGYVNKALHLSDSIGYTTLTAGSYVVLSTLYYLSTNNLSKTQEYLLKAKQLYDTCGDEKGLSFVYSNLSMIYFEQKEYVNALESIEKSLKIQEKVGDLFGMATSFHNRASVYLEMKRYSESLKNYQQEIAIFQKIGDQEGLSDAYSSMGELWIDQKKYSEAIRSCNISLQHATSLGNGLNLSKQNACECLYIAYSKQGNYKKAFEYMERFSLIKDSLKIHETEQKLRQMEIERDSLSSKKEQFEIEKNYQQSLRQKDKVLGIFIAAGLGIGFVAWAFGMRMLYFRRRSLRLQHRSETLERLQLMHEIDLLKTQVNPHFLFNSLSILSALIRVNPELSEQFVEQLARSYRYILEQKDQHMVPLRTEVEFIYAYAFLLKIRFENKFQVIMTLEETDLNHYKIAPLTLQLLIENAVKHNRMSIKEPLLITVTRETEYLVIRNNLQLRNQQDKSTRTGLQNIISRYELLSNLPLSIGEEDAFFVVKIPLLTDMTHNLEI